MVQIDSDMQFFHDSASQVLDFLLLNPLRASVEYYYLPTGLMSLQTIAHRNGFRGEIIDFNTIIQKQDYCNYRYIMESTLRQKLQKNRSIVLVGISILFSAVIERCLEIIQILRQFDKDIKIVAGGIHATMHYQKLLENCEALDYIVVGEGEQQFVDLLSFLKKKNHKPFENGIAYRQNGNVVISPRTSYIPNIDELGMVDYNLINLENYFPADAANWYSTKNVPPSVPVPILSSRACPYTCNFCSIDKVMGKKFRPKSANSVFSEIKYLHYERGINYFQIYDDNFTLVKSRAMAILTMIINDGMKIALNFLSGLSINHLDNELVDALGNAGASYIYLAIESGSEFMRNKVIGKNLSDDKIHNVVDYFSAKWPEIRISTFFIIGFPEETQSTLDDTVQMITSFNDAIAETFNCLPYFGTMLWDQCVRDNLLTFDHRDAWKRGYSIGSTPQSWYSKTGNTIHREFYIQPYNLGLDVLKEYRTIFDNLYKSKATKFSKQHRRTTIQS
jgi:magnesium-protoporphyrin IX monomethyl ester (oxidative) cyclase